MTYVAQRTCTTVNEDVPERCSGASSVPLGNFAGVSAYVLIGEPGAGKTTAFKRETDKQGGVYVTVRSFLTFDDIPKWHGKTLYLDGLDESRVGTVDGRTSLDRIRTKLDRLGRPPFRLSCRWADWFGSNDRERLKEVSPDGTMTVVRLDPLSKQNIKDILTKKYGVEDADDFIGKARDRRIDELLKNPQNLDMLVRSVSQGKWPESRIETFEESCRMLAREPNEEHRVGNQLSSNIDRLIAAAGKLCAVQLLTGCAGYTLSDRAVPDDEYPSFDDVAGEDKRYARHALKTRLFVGISEGRLAPVHRQISEFLAARYISRLVDHNLPLERVLALIKGFDGELPPAFQNFASWLAVHNKSSRKRLSQLNPSGLIYGGDEQTYSVEEKRDILLNLRREVNWNPWCSRAISKLSGIGKIVSPELEDEFRKILSDPERGHSHGSYVMLLLQMLADGKPLPRLSGKLQDIVVDSSWLPGVRCAALDVMIAYNRKDCLGNDILIKLIEEIESGTIEDSEDKFLGILLKALYPKIWSVDEIQKFLRTPKNISIPGEYADFWTVHVPRQSTSEQMAQLLDCIAAEFEDYKSFMVGEASRYTIMGVMPVKLLHKILLDKGLLDKDLLEKGLRGLLDTIAVDRLLRWLKMASETRMSASESLTVGIKLGLTWNQDKLKELIAHAVETCLNDHNVSQYAAAVEVWLFGARPFDYGPWCLEKTLAATDTKVATFYLCELLECVLNGAYSGGLTIERVREQLAGNTALLELLDKRMQQFEKSAPQGDVAHSRQSAADTRNQIMWQQQIAARAQELRASCGELHLLNQIAEVYLGVDKNVEGTTPSERLHNMVGSRLELVAVLHEGLEAVVDRADLPDCRRVVRLFDKRRTDFLVLPFIAGLDSLQRSGQLKIEELREDQIRLAVTVLYTLPGQYLKPEPAKETVLYRPEWFQTVLQDNPMLVADVLQRCVKHKHQTAIQPAVEFYHLARDDDHRKVASLAGIQLLERFPNMDTKQAAWELRWLLKAVLKNCDRLQVHHAVEKRLARTDLAPRQKICWLLAGHLTMPHLYREAINILSKDSEAASHSIWVFVSEGRFPMGLAREFLAGEYEFLIVLIASAIERHGMTKDGWWVISYLLEGLASIPNPQTTDILETLSTEPALLPWLPSISERRDWQARKRREHEFRHCNMRQAIRVLANKDPANAADLATLLLDVLKTLSKRIRDGSTSDWRQYWNVDHYNRPTNPKPEDACRDALLSDLRSHIEHLGIDAQPEGVYAADNRSDIRASFDRFNVPVEIKRSCHSNLWTAIKSQLIPKYTRDPGAAGYGIYVVFWFGIANGCSPTKYAGWTPPDTVAVEAKLTELMSDRERQMISICVIDVSQPAD